MSKEQVLENLCLYYGLLADSLKKQLKEHGLKFDYVEIEKFEMCKESISTLYIQGLLTESQKIKFVNKLHSKIVRHVAKCENLKPQSLK